MASTRCAVDFFCAGICCVKGMGQKKALCTALRYTTLGPVLYFDETQGQVNYVLCPILYYIYYITLCCTVLHCTTLHILYCATHTYTHTVL